MTPDNIYFMDTEFIEQPCTIDLISIALVCSDGREYYAISSEFDESKADDWVKENVIAKLGDEPRKTKAQIRDDILAFAPPNTHPEFWAYFADYDWVVFCWLFGKMVDLPNGYPFFCRDLKQYMEAHYYKKHDLPKQPEDAHNALADARWVKEAWTAITHDIIENMERGL